MTFKKDSDELDQMLLSHSTDYDKMRAKVQKLRQSQEFVRMMGSAQDKLYASIARGHRKVLVNLENGDSAAAAREAAKVVAWFHLRFQGDDPGSISAFPHIAKELLAVRELLIRSEILREAVSKCTGNDLHDA